LGFAKTTTEGRNTEKKEKKGEDRKGEFSWARRKNEKQKMFWWGDKSPAEKRGPVNQRTDVTFLTEEKKRESTKTDHENKEKKKARTYKGMAWGDTSPERGGGKEPKREGSTWARGQKKKESQKGENSVKKKTLRAKN